MDHIWTIDKSSPECFLENWHRVLKPEQALYICGRNAQLNPVWLVIAHGIIKGFYLQCSWYEISYLCRGLAWSPALVDKYMRPVKDYLTVRGNKHSFALLQQICITEARLRNYPTFPGEASTSYTYWAFQDLLPVLPSLPRRKQVKLALKHEDHRVILWVRPTKSEVESIDADFYTDECCELKALYLHEIGVKNYYNYQWEDWYEFLSEGKSPLDTDRQLNDELKECTWHYAAIIHTQGNHPRLEEFVDVLVDPKYTQPYYPHWIRVFVEKLDRVSDSLKTKILNRTKGDSAMTEWASSL